jgi:g-D-glutamyl-meso-diaminopimelate peptidase
MNIGIVTRSFKNMTASESAKTMAAHNFKCTELCFTQKDCNYWAYNGMSDITGLKNERVEQIVNTYRNNGSSVMGKTLYYVRLGKGNREVFYNGAHHANEWITTPLLMQFVENYGRAFSEGRNIRGYNIQQLYNSSSIYIVPLVNPDGVDLVNFWPNYINPVYREASLLNKTGLPLPRVWKANIKGVDLNLNYPAGWEMAKQQQLEAGITGPAPRDFGGEKPLSEPETIAIANFTRAHNFRLAIAYHTQGEVIYWQFMNLAPPISLEIGNIFSRISGYALIGTPGEAAFAGYKDWFIQEFRNPGYTIEVGRGANPLPISQLPGIYERNEEILLIGSLL